MLEGFVLDMTYGGRLASRWVAGKPEKTFLGMAKIRDKEQHFIQSFRCTKCGFLESYANKE
jgi:hypothetical protein